jgi:hypothetical protein
VIELGNASVWQATRYIFGKLNIGRSGPQKQTSFWAKFKAFCRFI